MSDLRTTYGTTGADISFGHAFHALQGDAAFTGDPVASGTEGLLVERAGVPVARLSLHLRSGLVGAPGLSGLLGHYEAIDAGAGVHIIREGSRVIRERGAVRILGPMNGSTWSRYRFAVAGGGDEPVPAKAPWFAGEPYNPPQYPDHWRAAGMSVVSTYESRVEVLGERDDAGDVGGGRIRTIDMADFDGELAELHRVSLDAFDANYLYSPISLETFSQMYAPFRERLDPEFILLAENDDGIVTGYIFSYGDPLSIRDGRPTRLIIKTLAVAKAGRGARVSSALLDRVRRLARLRGYEQVISALMRSDNVTRGMARRRSSQLLRRYELYGMSW